MRRIEKAISFYRGKPLYMDLSWIVLMDYALSPETKDYVEGGTLDLAVLAYLIKKTIIEVGEQNKDQINDMLWNKLHDDECVEEAKLTVANLLK